MLFGVIVAQIRIGVAKILLFSAFVSTVSSFISVFFKISHPLHPSELRGFRQFVLIFSIDGLKNIRDKVVSAPVFRHFPSFLTLD